MACLIHAFFYAKRIPAMGLHDRRGAEKAKGGILQERKADARVSRKKSPCHGRDKNVWNGCFLCVTVLSASQSSPKTVPKPQQERGFAVGEKRSKGKRISSKPLQGSLFVAFAVQRSGIHLPKEFTMILTVRNSFTIVNRPMVTLTAMGAPRAASPLLWEESQSQPQEWQH